MVPGKETFEIIKMTDIPDDFCDLKLKEFKVYWIERGQKKNNWNSAFIDYLRREWTKEINSEKNYRIQLMKIGILMKMYLIFLICQRSIKSQHFNIYENLYYIGKIRVKLYNLELKVH